jgi:hypothetical protein
LLQQSSEIASVFFHVQWNKLRGKSHLEGHERNLRVSNAVRNKGMALLLMFDFTHDGQDRSRKDLGVGQINKFPDQSELPPGGLDNPLIREAYQAELLAVAEAIAPEYVRIGVEINIFHNALPEMWPAYVEMYSDCYDALRAQYPGMEISAYTARPPDDAMMNALSMLVPKMDSLGYSFYYDAPWDIPEEYWTRILQLDPTRPLFVPEFGVRSTGGKVEMPDFGIERLYKDVDVNLETQHKALEFLLDHFSTLNTQALVWFSLYDQDYSAAPEWFGGAHSTIGLIDRNRKEKPAFELWKATCAIPVQK